MVAARLRDPSSSLGRVDFGGGGGESDDHSRPGGRAKLGLVPGAAEDLSGTLLLCVLWRPCARSVSMKVSVRVSYKVLQTLKRAVTRLPAR